MSAVETQTADSRSSVKLSRNAKGETQVEVKVYVGDTLEQVREAERIAQTVYGEVCGSHR